MRVILILGLLIGLCLTTGCANMTQSGADVRASYVRSFKYDLLQMADDFNYMMMLDRPTRLSKWVTR